MAILCIAEKLLTTQRDEIYNCSVFSSQRCAQSALSSGCFHGVTFIDNYLDVITHPCHTFIIARHIARQIQFLKMEGHNQATRYIVKTAYMIIHEGLLKYQCCIEIIASKVVYSIMCIICGTDSASRPLVRHLSIFSKPALVDVVMAPCSPDFDPIWVTGRG